ncbi:MAG: hypothetical protein GVY35_03530 [Bacteroidetes bacterium]|nr:hypothetical protein [Bacteroidota bacterium]
MEALLTSIACVLRNALHDVGEARRWFEQEDRRAYDQNGEETARRLMQSIEYNLTETVVGIRLIQKQNADPPPERPHGG